MEFWSGIHVYERSAKSYDNENYVFIILIFVTRRQLCGRVGTVFGLDTCGSVRPSVGPFPELV